MLFITALDTGMRQGELLALTWNDVDLTNRTITVNKTYKVVKDLNTEKYVGTIQPPKTQKVQELYQYQYI
ncbi:tyrosine-type recombinase/integrase [Clostridium septicum]|uniref:tyrosine-type recombinase/integrase n=1 Tax=Clostridium septicum TaxID=1504 RepID=UPI001FA9C8BF|nr:tyrosine-type recombinase/integrase [Clostridium septicum]